MKKLILAVTLALVSLSPLSAQQKNGSGKGLRVTEALLGKDVQNKKLVDTTSTFLLNERAYFWFRVVGGPSDSITVTWKTGDQKYTSKLNVGGSPWRTWSYKTMAVAGDWKVTVTDAEGNILKEMSFTVAGSSK